MSKSNFYKPKKVYSLLAITFFIFSKTIKAQTQKDSIQTLKEVNVKAYLSERKLFHLPSTVTLVGKNKIEDNNSTSLVPVMNQVAGVKMEERSPGSYRLSIRGSLLRSPFGVRNIKVYFDGLPLTDASGNTYLNLIDQSAINNIEVLKGPDGSLFGANSGGVVLLNSQGNENEVSVSGLGGSYGFFRENVHIQQKHRNYEYSVHQAFQYADGYREHSQMKRSYFQTQQKLQYIPKAALKFSGFYSDLGYQTPGGLTKTQLAANPRQSRPATPFAPGARDQDAGIYNRSFFGGITHLYEINQNWQHHISLSGMDTDFENPFITNYEKRSEASMAVSTFFTHQKQASTSLKYSWNFGYEYQHTTVTVRNYENNAGEAGNIMAADRIKNQSQFVFTQLRADIGKRLSTEISASLNFDKFDFEALPESQGSNAFGTVKLNNELTPKIALSYLLSKELVLRAIASRGYSTPTAEEIRGSNALINPDLKSEDGWNYELGLRARTPFESVYLDFSAFYYRLNNAIVRRVAANDEDFYVNAGGTNQKGIELELNSKFLDKNPGFINKIDFSTALTLSNFTFRNYTVESNDYSGNLLTGIPKFSISNSLSTLLLKSLTVLLNHQYTGKTSLNDAETEFAKKFNLLDAELNWRMKVQRHLLNLKIGGKNLLNEDYSLGNDLNAYGSRYYNPAAKRHFYAGFQFKL